MEDKKDNIAQDIHLHEHLAPTYNINIGYVDKQINGDYYECTPSSQTATVAKPRPVRKKVLFIKDNSQYVEDIEVKKNEAKRLVGFLKEHKLSGRNLTTQQGDILNQAIVEFLRRWKDSKLIGDHLPGTALFRFLTEDVNLGTEVAERAYANKITQMIDNLDVSIDIQKKVGSAFK